MPVSYFPTPVLQNGIKMTNEVSALTSKQHKKQKNKLKKKMLNNFSEQFFFSFSLFISFQF
jgi:hypothetical protein